MSLPVAPPFFLFLRLGLACAEPNLAEYSPHFHTYLGNYAAFVVYLVQLPQGPKWGRFSPRSSFDFDCVIVILFCFHVCVCD
jgi:hypothetical protein